MKPIFFQADEMSDDVLVLLRKVRSEIALSRGKLSDIISAYGWNDRIEIPEKGLTMVLQSLHLVMVEIEQARK